MILSAGGQVCDFGISRAKTSTNGSAKHGLCLQGTVCVCWAGLLNGMQVGRK